MNKNFLLRSLTPVCVFLTMMLFAWGMHTTLAQECEGKPYGYPGCPVKTQASASSVSKMCGNGVLDDGEECDKGASRNGLSNCTKSCTLLYCGDGITSPGNNEQCDPADPAFGQIEEVYARDPDTGELIVERRYLQPSCGYVCTVPVCDEEGNCNGGCTMKSLKSCSAQQNAQKASSAAAAVVAPAGATQHAAAADVGCGDGIVQPGEECDDGDAVDTNNCTNACRLPVCGDSLQQPWEQCDDGNVVDGDACSNECKLPACGDGAVQTGEECDDGNQLSNDACTSACKLAACGDGIIQAGEDCDDGNGVDADACSNKCARPRCGDAIIQTGEECDDGNGINDDACSNSCRQPRCGDAIMQLGEECDDGNRNPADGCNNLCRLPVCGNAAVEPGEECDDGNKLDGDACTNVCKRPTCGDNILQAGEECDDGNQVNDDMCTKACRMLRCGDGILQTGEECDDGRDNSNAVADGCRKNCRLSRCGDKVVDTGEECDGTEGCTPECKVGHAAASLSSGLIGGGTMLVIGLTGLLVMIGSLLYFSQGKFGKFLRKTAKKTMASIDDIPLDEIEMPWHRWQ